MTSIHSLRKTATGLHLAYKYGASTDKLRGTHITLEVDGPVLTLAIDLTLNLRKRDKHSATYQDALALARDHHKLKLLQCHDNLVRNRLVRAWESAQSPQLKLSLTLESMGTYMYTVAPRSLFMGGIELDVLSVIEAEDEEILQPGWTVQPASPPFVSATALNV